MKPFVGAVVTNKRGGVYKVTKVTSKFFWTDWLVAGVWETRGESISQYPHSFFIDKSIGEYLDKSTIIKLYLDGQA